MKLLPIYDRIIAKRITQEGKTPQPKSSSTETSDEAPQEALVISVGRGKPTKVSPLKTGDKIFISKRSGSEVKINGEIHLILSMDDVISIVET